MFGPNDFDTASQPYGLNNFGLAPEYYYQFFADGLTQAGYPFSTAELQTFFPNAILHMSNAAGEGSHTGGTGTNGSDLILTFQGNDVIDAGDGDDLVFLGFGDDAAFGGKGDDWLFGYDGNDILSGWRGNDMLFGGAGDDQMNGGSGHDSLYGEDGNDLLKGASGKDWLFGGAGEDTLQGGNHDDHLDGGADNDSLHGGKGADVFYFAAGSGRDTVRDFDFNEGDQLDLDISLGVNDFAGAMQAASQTGNHVTFDFGNGDEFVIRNVDVNDFSAGDFVF